MDIPENLSQTSGEIFLSYRGSIAHNMYVPNSDPNSVDDVDIIGIVIPADEYYFGLKEWGSRGTKEVKQGSIDAVFYEIRKAFDLLLKGNPNIMSILWTLPEHVIKQTLHWRWIMPNRNLFIGSHVYHSFVGYAYGQMHKMTHGQKQGYMGDKRALLVEKYGYDTKNAAHLIRLLKMCREFLDTGEMQVYRVTDRDELLSIKTGKWTLDAVKAYSDQLFEEAKVAYEKSPLPKMPAREAAENLLIDILRDKIFYYDITPS